MIIIIGASGYIGSNLKKYLEEKGNKVIGTSFLEKQQDLKYFNVETSSLKDLNINLNEVTHTVICSGINNINECKQNEEKAYKINVEGNKRIIKQCFENNIVPIFLSSDAVFNGEKGNYTELDETCPCNVYGKHKKIIEDFLLNSNEKYLIARLSKVFGVNKDKTFLTNWAEQLKNNETLKCATDQIFCPIYIKDLVQILDLVIQKNLSNLYNIASPEQFSRFELATKLKSTLKINSGEVISCSIKNIPCSDSLPPNISLNTKKIREATNHNFTTMQDCLNQIKFI